LAQFVSPKGVSIVGTYEKVPAAAGIIDIDPKTGVPEYDGSGSTLFWDDQKQVVNYAGKRLYLDEDGNAWPFDQLKRVENEEC
jgi:hypothetical protein